MKKVLFATTALIATGGMAAADVTLSGSGRFGIVYNDSAALTSSTKIEKRMTINIDGSGSTDGGLEFGGRIRLRSDENEAGSGQSSANVFMGNDMFRITVGNTDGALLNRVGYYQGSVGLTGLQWANVSFNIGTNTFYLNSFSSRGGGAADVVRLDFNAGGFGVSLSTDSTGDHTSGISEDAIAVSYNFGDWTAAAGIAKDANGAGQDATSLSIVGSIGDFGVGLGYTDLKTIGNKVTLSGSYSFGVQIALPITHDVSSRPNDIDADATGHDAATCHGWSDQTYGSNDTATGEGDRSSRHPMGRRLPLAE